MDILTILSATIAGTTLMTAFSYLVSKAFSKLFKEPVLLNYVLRSSNIKMNPKRTSIIGWVLHYVIGLFFVLGYEWIWNRELMPISWLSGLLLGAASGIIGIIGWIILFSLPADRPKVSFTEYFIQLFFAHIIFALTVVAVYKLL